MKRFGVESGTKARLVLVLILVAVVILGWPLVRGLGVSFGYGEQEAVGAQAELLVAQAELSRAQAEVYREFSASLDSLPATLVEVGRASLFLGLAIVTVLLGIGGLVIITALAHHVYISGRIKEHNAQYQIQSMAYNPILPSSTSGVDNILDGDISYGDPEWVDVRGFSVDKNPGDGSDAVG